MSEYLIYRPEGFVVHNGRMIRVGVRFPGIIGCEWFPYNPEKESIKSMDPTDVYHYLRALALGLTDRKVIKLFDEVHGVENTLKIDFNAAVYFDPELHPQWIKLALEALDKFTPEAEALWRLHNTRYENKFRELQIFSHCPREPEYPVDWPLEASLVRLPRFDMVRLYLSVEKQALLHAAYGVEDNIMRFLHMSEEEVERQLNIRYHAYVTRRPLSAYDNITW